MEWKAWRHALERPTGAVPSTVAWQRLPLRLGTALLWGLGRLLFGMIGGPWDLASCAVGASATGFAVVNPLDFEPVGGAGAAMDQEGRQ